MELITTMKEQERKVKFQLSLSPEIDTKFRKYVSSNYGGTRRGTLSTELEIALSKFIESKGGIT
jgi:hypothetical protein